MTLRFFHHHGTDLRSCCPFSKDIAIRPLLFWLLFPMLLPQALWVRKTAPRTAAAAGPNHGSAGLSERQLLALGDSIIAGVGTPNTAQALPAQTAQALAILTGGGIGWQALGNSGATSAQLLQSLQAKLPAKPVDYILISVGVNDVTGLVPIARFKRHLHALLQQLTVHSPNAVIAIAGIPPLRGFPLLPEPLRTLFGWRGDAFDEAIKEVTSDHAKVTHAVMNFDPKPDLFSEDGYHPSVASYAVFGTAMAKALAEKQAALLHTDMD